MLVISRVRKKSPGCRMQTKVMYNPKLKAISQSEAAASEPWLAWKLRYLSEKRLDRRFLGLSEVGPF